MSKFDIAAIRNLAFVGHGSVGKTTLIDALLFHAKAVDRKGSVDDGSSVLDYDEEEKIRKQSIEEHIAHLDWKGKRFHILDCPGAPDFVGHAISAIHNVETVCIVVDAHKGIEVNTRRMFEEAGAAGCARVIIIDKLDTDNVSFEPLVNRIRESFGDACELVEVPVGLGQKFSGVVELIHHASGPAAAVVDPVKQHDHLVEKIVEGDDQLLEKFLEGEAPADDKLVDTLHLEVARGDVVPILCVSGKKDVGLGELLDVLAEIAPSPLDCAGRKAVQADETITLTADRSKPFVGRVFKCHADKFGNLTYVRVFQGSLKANTSVKCARDGGVHRLGQLNTAQGKTLEKVDEIGAGEFLVVAKVEGVNINDTLSTDGAISLPPVVFPKPMFPLAVSAKTRADDVKVMQALRKVAHEDPCFEIHRDEQTLETVMTGLSQLHLEVVQNRLKHRDHLELVTHEPKIPYKETIGKPSESMYRHKKQTGGRGQFAEVHLRLHPRERGTGFEFVNSVVGGSIPGQFIPAVEKGIRETMARGVLAGCEVVDLVAEVHFGKYHDVDSSEQAFKYAARMAFKDAFAKAAPLLLEPIVNIEVIAPIDKMGDISGDLNTRRARITGMDVLPGNMQVVRAEAPLSEMMRYQTELKSMTAGMGSFSMASGHLAPTPTHVQTQVVQKYKLHAKEEVEE